MNNKSKVKFKCYIFKSTISVVIVSWMWKAIRHFTSMSYGPDLSDSDDSYLSDDGGYYEFKVN